MASKAQRDRDHHAEGRRRPCAIRFTGRMAPENSTAGKHSIGRASVAWATLPTDRRGEQAEAEGGDRAQQQADADRGVRRRAGDSGRRSNRRSTPSMATTTSRRNGHEDRHLRRHVGAEPQADEALAAQDRALGADLQQAVGEPEEERGEDDPEPDHHHRARARVVDVERAGPEQDGEHGDDQRRRPDQDRQRQAVAHEDLERPLGEHSPLREPARPPVAGCTSRAIEPASGSASRRAGWSAVVGDARRDRPGGGRARGSSRPRTARAPRRRFRRSPPAHLAS